MNRYLTSLTLIAVFCLQGCGSQPGVEPEPADAEPVPEITLTMPKADCECDQQSTDYTFLDKGFTALHEEEYLESLQYFQRYQRIEKTPQADAEAQIAVAYLSILPDSPLYDRKEAGNSYRKLRRKIDPDWKLHGRVVLMQDSLETFLELQHELAQARKSNANLRKELAIREEAIKRLRDLTLGREPETEE
jgi:hypothetical protein